MSVTRGREHETDELHYGDIVALRRLSAAVVKPGTEPADNPYAPGASGIVPPFEDIIASLREDHRREGFWDDSGTLG